jgi:hypothetical protein
MKIQLIIANAQAALKQNDLAVDMYKVGSHCMTALLNSCRMFAFLSTGLPVDNIEIEEYQVFNQSPSEPR